jgi:hypothetical protein
MDKYPKVFIVILNYNGKDVIKNCLKSVFKINYPNLEIVVVDNGSIDGSLEMVKADFSRAHFIKNTVNLGFSTGNNVGIRFALEKMADFVLLLNSDTEVEPDFLSKLIKASMIDKTIGISSPIVFKNKTKNIWFAGGSIDWLKMKSYHTNTIKDSVRPYESGFISGCAMLIKKDVFRECGLLDEDFFLYWEDVDFSVRAQKANFKTVVVPTSTVYHFEKSEGNKPHKIYWLVLSGLLFFKKNAAFPLSLWLKIYVFLRRIKNYHDVSTKKDPNSLAVQKAYQDFAKL